jgi:hypothetical protein
MDKADCFELMGYRIIDNFYWKSLLEFSVSLFGWGPARGTICAGVYESSKKILEL